MFSDTKFKDQQGNEYSLHNKIGSGGFGAVYEVKKVGSVDRFAVKVLPTDFTNILKNDYKALINEGKTALKIKSDNVVEYIHFNDGIDTRTGPYILMKFESGGNLSELINSKIGDGSKFNEGEIRSYIYQICNGMIAIHDAGFIHRDIKPQNILVSSDGILKITDFGLAKIADEYTRSSSFKGRGTYEYISPEGWNNNTNTKQMDVYSAGLVLYKLVTLKGAYDTNQSDSIDWRNIHLFEEPIDILSVRPKLDKKIGSVIMKMILKNTDYRYGSFNDVLEDIAKVKNDVEENSYIDDQLESRRTSLQSKRQKDEIEKLTKENERKAQEDLRMKVNYSYRSNIVKEIESLCDYLNKNGETDDLYKFENDTMYLIGTDGKRRIVSFSLEILYENLFDYTVNNRPNGYYNPIDRKMIPEKQDLRYRDNIEGNKIIGFLRIKTGIGNPETYLFLSEDKVNPLGKWYNVEYKVGAFRGGNIRNLELKELLEFYTQEKVIGTEFDVSVNEFNLKRDLMKTINLS